MRKQMQKTNFVLRAWAVLALVLLLGRVTTVSAQSQSVDNMRVTLSMKQVTLKTFLDEVSKQTGLQFDVDASLLEKADRVSIDAREQPVRAVLGQVLNVCEQRDKVDERRTILLVYMLFGDEAGDNSLMIK